MKTSSRLVVAAVFAFAVISSGEAQNARQRQLIDTGWRFELGDPADILTNPAETNVTYYPEISDLAEIGCRRGQRNRFGNLYGNHPG